MDVARCEAMYDAKLNQCATFRYPGSGLTEGFGRGGGGGGRGGGRGGGGRGGRGGGGRGWGGHGRRWGRLGGGYLGSSPGWGWYEAPYYYADGPDCAINAGQQLKQCILDGNTTEACNAQYDSTLAACTY